MSTVYILFPMFTVCPEANSITVVQEYRPARPTGLTNLTCHFRVPTAKFYQYSWLLGDEKAFIHGVSDILGHGLIPIGKQHGHMYLVSAPPPLFFDAPPPMGGN